MSSTSTADVDTLSCIFGSRPGIHRAFLESVLEAHAGDISRACYYISNLSDTQILSRCTQVDTIATLKDIAIPTLQSHLQHLPLPCLCGETDRVKYALQDVTLSSVHIPESAVDVVQSENRVCITARDISLTVQVADWSYRIRFPPLRDQGTALMSLSGVKVHAVLSMHASNLQLAECQCQITGSIHLRAHQARLSWLYNSLTPLLRTAYRPTLQSALTQAIHNAIEQQLHDWSHWLS